MPRNQRRIPDNGREVPDDNIAHIKYHVAHNYQPVAEGEGMVKIDGQEYNMASTEDVERAEDWASEEYEAPITEKDIRRM